MKIIHLHLRTSRRRRHGFVLIIILWITVALTAVVLVLARESQVEHLTAAQHLSQAQCDTAEVGVEQYVAQVVEQEVMAPSYKDNIQWEQRELGDCYYWVITPRQVWSGDTDETQFAFGITDEASKIDLNYMTEAMYEMLPGVDQMPNIAAAIVDWRNPDDTVTSSQTSGAQGAESETYPGTYGYNAKNANFENLDELRMVAGLTPIDDPNNASVILWGADLNHNGVIDANEVAGSSAGMNASNTTARGMMPYVTVWGFQATNPAPVPAGAGPTTANPTTDPITGATIPAAAITDITYTTPLDINSINTAATNYNAQSRTLLTQLIQQYAPARSGTVTTSLNNHYPQARGGGGGAGGNTTVKPYTNVWQFILEAQFTSDDLSAVTSDGVTPLFCLLTCTNPPPTQAQITTATNNGTPLPMYQFAKLNMNSAGEQAIMCLPGFTQTDADAIIQYRQTLVGQDPSQVPNISWLLDCLSDPTILTSGATTQTGTTPTQGTTGATTQSAATTDASLQAGSYITGQSTVFSAEIVTASKDGRAFKRVKVVIDDTSGAAVIVYRRDLTDAGWPLRPELRDQIREAYKQGVSLNVISPPTSGTGISGGPLFGQ